MKPSSSKRVVAAAHFFPVYMNVQATIDKTVGIIEKAGQNGIDLLVFPETFLPGFPYFIMCYPPVDTVAAVAAYVDASIEVPGPEIARLQNAAKQACVALVVGFSERLAGTRTCFNSQVYIDNDGSLLGVHRKLQPTFMERMLWGQGGGATLKVFDSNVGRIGGLCCWEHTMNLARQGLIMQGEQIHAAAWPSMAVTNSGSGVDMVTEVQVDAMMKNHALTGQCFVVAAGLPTDQACLDWMDANLGPQKRIALGGGWSAVIDPFNNYLSGPHTGLEERFVKAEIDLDAIKLLKVWADGAGHYSRPEILRLQVDRRAIWHDESDSPKSPAPSAVSDGDSEPAK